MFGRGLPNATTGRKGVIMMDSTEMHENLSQKEWQEQQVLLLPKDASSNHNHVTFMKACLITMTFWRFAHSTEVPEVSYHPQLQGRKTTGGARALGWPFSCSYAAVAAGRCAARGYAGCPICQRWGRRMGQEETFRMLNVLRWFQKEGSVQSRGPHQIL